MEEGAWSIHQSILRFLGCAACQVPAGKTRCGTGELTNEEWPRKSLNKIKANSSIVAGCQQSNQSHAVCRIRSCDETPTYRHPAGDTESSEAGQHRDVVQRLTGGRILYTIPRQVTNSILLCLQSKDTIRVFFSKF